MIYWHHSYTDSCNSNPLSQRSIQYISTTPSTVTRATVELGCTISLPLFTYSTVKNKCSIDHISTPQLLFFDHAFIYVNFILWCPAQETATELQIIYHYQNIAKIPLRATQPKQKNDTTQQWYEPSTIGVTDKDAKEHTAMFVKL